MSDHSILQFSPQIFLQLTLISLSYLTALAFYRLYFSPLASYPGPKLTAVSGWVETYYELIHGGGGQFLFKIEEWHKAYGPIVRINPHELHINDAEFYESIYHTFRALDKPKSMELRYGLPYATFSTANHNLHKLRRSPVQPLFSTQSITKFVPTINACVDQLCERLSRDFNDDKEPVDLVQLWASLTTDIITKFSFGYSYNLIDAPAFTNPFANAVHILEDMVHWTTAFPSLRDIIFHCPRALIKTVVPPTRYFFDLQEHVRERIVSAQEDVINETKRAKLQQRGSTTFFHTLLTSDLPAFEKSLPRLIDEGSAITSAGTETTRWALSVTCFHVLDNPDITLRLRNELDRAILDCKKISDLNDLEKLPYLNACIQEGLRLAYGAVSRSPRLHPTEETVYKSWRIPAGTQMSTQAYSMHHNEAAFPDSFSYIPERWLGEARAPHTGKKLNRYMVAFGRGSRICIGMNLALAEMRIALAVFFRRFDVTLYQTTREDVDCHWAALGARPKKGSKGVRVTVRNREHAGEKSTL